MHRFLELTLNGLTLGMVYAAVALGLVLIWRGTRIVNFAQGAMAMVSTYVAVSLLDRHAPYWAAFAAALACGLVLGAVVERVLVRPVEAKAPINAVILTLGLLLLLEAVAAMVWGANYRAFPAPFSIAGFKVGRSSIPLSPFDVFVVAVVLALMAALAALFRRTGLGLRMRAAAFSPEVARLLGVRVGRMFTLGWALSSLSGALAGVLVAPTVLVSPNVMDNVLVLAFTAAVLGSLDSPVGALVGGVVIGLALSYVTGYLGSELQSLGALAILVAVLMVRPEGLFGRSRARRV